MKTKNLPDTKKLPKGFKVNSTLTGKYSNEPFFMDKVEKTNQILKTVGLPKA